MVMIGDANLQNVAKLCEPEVNVLLNGLVLVQSPQHLERELERGGLRPDWTSPGWQWWPRVRVAVPWILIRPTESTLSSRQLADCAFILRRRPVTMNMNLAAWTWP